MPGRDGTGPMRTGRGMSRQMGFCYNSTADTREMIQGCGNHMRSRLRDGTCCFAGIGSDMDTLTAEKKILESKLKLVEEMLQSNHYSKPADQSNA